MAKFNNKNQNAKRANTTPRIAPVTKFLPLVITGKDARGNDYDPQQVTAMVSHISNCTIFSILNVGASMPKALCFNNDELKGQINVARILSYTETGDMELLFTGKNTEYANLTDGMVIVPRVRMNRSGEVETIMSFDIVPAMEA